MSREQWGHGYYTGLKAQSKNDPKYVVEYHNGFCNSVAIIHEKKADTYVVEYINYLDMLYNFALRGAYPSLKKCDIIPEQVKECKLEDFENPKFYYAWETVLGEFIKAEKHFKRNGA